MKQLVFTVYDSKTQAYMSPFFTRSVGEAIRSWETVCNDGQSMMSKHPSDFTLFQTGEFDDSTGRFTQLDALTPLGTALQAKKPTEANLPLDLAARRNTQ